MNTDVLIDQISDKSRLCQTPLSAQERQVMMQVAVERRGVHCKECVGAGPRAWNGTDFRVGAHRHVLLFLFLVLLFFSLFLSPRARHKTPTLPPRSSPTLPFPYYFRLFLYVVTSEVAYTRYITHVHKTALLVEESIYPSIYLSNPIVLTFFPSTLAEPILSTAQCQQAHTHSTPISPKPATNNLGPIGQ